MKQAANSVSQPLCYIVREGRGCKEARQRKFESDECHPGSPLNHSNSKTVYGPVLRFSLQGQVIFVEGSRGEVVGKPSNSFIIGTIIYVSANRTPERS